MKLTDKRFWNGEKTIYYPSFKYALTHSLLYSVLWLGVICLWLFALWLILHFTNGSNLSWDMISVILLFLSVVFCILNGMFLYKNWYKQKHIIGKIKELLPDEYCWKRIDYNATNKKYTILGNYQNKTFIIRVIYPILNIKEKGSHTVTTIRIDADKETLEKHKQLILNCLNSKKYYCTICGLALENFAPWSQDNKTPTYNICPCCGVEWGNEDYTSESCKEYRNKWIESGAKWFDPQKKPANWNLKKQLRNIGYELTDK